MEYDLVIVGSGPGGYVAAIRASQLGLRVAIIEKDSLGGVCLNWGCIPTKSFLRSAEVLKLVKSSDNYGIKSELLDVDINAIVKRSRDIAKKLSKGVEYLLKKNKVSVYLGEAVFIDKNRLAVEQLDKGQIEVVGSNFIIATGGSPQTLPFIKAKKNVWYYKDALVADEIPKKLLVIGSGAIGVEFASFFNQMGSEVTLVESQAHIVPNEDIDVSDYVEKHFTKNGINIIKKCMLSEVFDTNIGISAKFMVENKEYVSNFNKVIVAAGIIGNVDGLNLEKLGIKNNNKSIEVDEFCKTNLPNIFAIGDVASAPWLAHKASHEGVLVAEILGGKEPRTIDRENIPACTFCDPEIASIGLTENGAREKGLNFKVGVFPFSANGKALAMGYENGFVKTIIDSVNGEILGVHMVGPGVTELIHSYSLAMESEIIEENIERTIFPHPTLSESIHESVLKALGKEIHI
jgi:dihydrolipoamide dehydrogenase